MSVRPTLEVLEVRRKKRDSGMMRCTPTNYIVGIFTTAHNTTHTIKTML